tara:strand:- start:1364 stop:4846 length:3483 start_codon:yes stop_codon:yes gene_type:complete
MEHENTLVRKDYRYDVLGRIKESAHFHYQNGALIKWKAGSKGNNDPGDYRTSYSYDPNGNLESLVRNAGSGGAGNAMDNIRYRYNLDNDGNKINNQLKSIEELQTNQENGNHNDIAEDHNYCYDEEGKLVKESYFQNIDRDSSGTRVLHEVDQFILWNSSNKVRKVHIIKHPMDSTSGFSTIYTSLDYGYSPTGNRNKKTVSTNPLQSLTVEAMSGCPTETVTPVFDSAHADFSLAKNTTTFYTHDASGNVMATYKRTIEETTNPDEYKATYELQEQYIYGSGRIGQSSLPHQDRILAEHTFNASEENIDEFSFSTADVTYQSGYKTWISPSNSSSTLSSGQTNLCNCEIRENAFDQTNAYADSSINQSFMGHTTNNVAVGENANGEAVFFGVVPHRYLGQKNKLLLYQPNGNLIKGTADLAGDPESKIMITQHPGNPSQYYLLGVNPQGNLVYHIVDVNEIGYGTSLAAGGEVIKSNQLIGTGSTSRVYGKHITVLEDHLRQTTIAYIPVYVESPTPSELGTIELEYVEIDKTGSVTTGVLSGATAMESLDKKAAGEISLSEDGSSLVYYNRKKFIAGFNYQQVELHHFNLGDDRKNILEQKELLGSDAGTSGKSSVGIDKNGVLYFNQNGLYKEKLQINSVEVESERVTLYGEAALVNLDLTKGELLPTVTYGDIRRGQDDKVYIAGADQATGKYTAFSPLNNQLDLAGTGYVPADNPTRDGIDERGYLPGSIHKILKRTQGIFTRTLGYKQYEFKDHLGNVRTTLSDARLAKFDDARSTTEPVNYPDVISSADYYPFGMQMSGRTMSATSYRYGFNTQEKENEIAEGIYTAHFWKYDSRIGKRWSLDPAYKHHLSNYSVLGNNPIVFVDPNGDDWFECDGDIRWNDSQEQNITHNEKQYKNIGSALEFETRSFIPKFNDTPFPEPLMELFSGDKLTTKVTIKGNYNDKGEFTGFSYNYNRKIYATFNLKALKGTETVPGKTNSPEGNIASGNINGDGSGGYSLDVETHTTTPKVETIGLKLFGSNVDVNQKINFSIDSDGKLNIDVGHGTYPSVTMKVNSLSKDFEDKYYYQYAAQSFIHSHATNIKMLKRLAGNIFIRTFVDNMDHLNKALERANRYQRYSDAQNTEYRKTNKANFSGFTAGPTDPNSYSSLKWKY